MPTRAYILMEAAVGQIPQVVEALRSLRGIVSADAITGNFDIIALVEAPDMAGMADLVTSRVQGIPGVVRTITCVAAG